MNAYNVDQLLFEIRSATVVGQATAKLAEYVPICSLLGFNWKGQGHVSPSATCHVRSRSQTDTCHRSLTGTFLCSKIQLKRTRQSSSRSWRR